MLYRMAKQVEGEEEGIEGEKIGKRGGNAVDPKGRKLGQPIPDEVRRKLPPPKDK